jgi:phytoene dehydrogenase-like protein
MAKSWDVIVIGAGIGGLTAAAKLVKADFRVLILEKSLHPGGTAYTYSRKGFTFPMGPLGFSTPALVRDTLTDVGQGENLHFHRVHYGILASGLQIRLSLPFDQIKIELTRRFPEESKGLDRFFYDMKRILSTRNAPVPEIDGYQLYAKTGTSAQEYICRLIEDRRLSRLLGSLGTRDAYSSLPLLAAQWNLMCNEGIWYPQGGMDAFCRKLARGVVGNGQNKQGKGELRFGTAVHRIKVNDGRVSGVTLADGSEMDSTRIICNADYKTTFMKLLRRRDTPGRWYQAVATAKQSGSVFQVCLGVDADRVDFSIFSDASRIIYRRYPSGTQHMPNWEDRRVRPEAIAGQELEVSLWSRENPGLAPDGGAVIVIRTEADHAHFTQYRPTEGKRHSAYHAYKMQLAEALVREVNHVVPGLERAVIALDVATPLTFEERGGRSEGAVAGWSWDYADNPDYTPSELVLTPIHGLYMAGYQAYSALFMGGVPMAMASGGRAAEACLDGTGPVHEVKIPGAVAPGGSGH